MKKTLLVLSVVFLLTSCVVTSNIDLSENNANARVEATEFFSLLLEDLSSFTRTEEDISLMNQSMSDFVLQLLQTRNVYDLDFSKEEDKEYYNLSFSFTELESLLSALSGQNDQSILTVEEDDLSKIIKLDISMSNYDQLEEMVPFLKQEDIAVYCARYNQDYTEEEYLTMMNFIAGEEAEEGIKSSYVRLNLTLPNQIIKTNGNIISSDCVSFEFKMIDFLLLHSPITFYCKF